MQVTRKHLNSNSQLYSLIWKFSKCMYNNILCDRLYPYHVMSSEVFRKLRAGDIFVMC